jgi:hypothetical protein
MSRFNALANSGFVGLQVCGNLGDRQGAGRLQQRLHPLPERHRGAEIVDGGEVDARYTDTIRREVELKTDSRMSRPSVPFPIEETEYQRRARGTLGIRPLYKPR